MARLIRSRRPLLVLVLALTLLLTACGEEGKPATTNPTTTSGGNSTPGNNPNSGPLPTNQQIGYATKPVAKVNGTDISAADFNHALDQLRVATEEQEGGTIDWSKADNQKRLTDLRTQVLEGLVNFAVVAQEAAKELVTVAPAEIDESINSFKDSVGGDSGYQRWLATRFLSEADYRESLRQGILFGKMRDKHSAVEEKAEQVRARHILVATLPEAQQIYAKLQGGGDFAALATQFSLDTVSARKGGDLDWVLPGQFEPAFEKAAFALKPNEFSGPIKTSLGYHIIQSLGKEVRPLPLDFVAQRKQEAFSAYIKSLRDKAKIETSL